MKQISPRLYGLALLVLLLAAARLPAGAQVELTVTIPVSGMIAENQLVNAYASNGTAQALPCLLEISLRNRLTGDLLASGTSQAFSLPPGGRLLTTATIGAVPLTFSGAATAGAQSGFLTVGNYQVCHRLFRDGEVGMPLATTCTQVDVEPMLPPQLQYPPDTARLRSQGLYFSWLDPSPLQLFRQLSYDLVVAQQDSGQSAVQAIQQNIPVLVVNNLSGNFHQPMGGQQLLAPGHDYVWMVYARDGAQYAAATTVRQFSITADTAGAAALRRLPYVRLRLNEPEMGMALNGVIRYAYDNLTGDSSVLVTIRSLRNEAPLFSGPLAIAPGTNEVELNTGRNTLVPGLVYRVELLNSRKERWVCLVKPATVTP